MAKRNKLSDGQKRRVRANREKRLKKTDSIDWEDEQLASPEDGIVISRFGQHADVQTQDGLIFRCNIRRTVESIVCGDQVLFRRSHVVQSGISGIIEAVHERRTVLTRPDYYDGIKAIAANLDQVFIVSAILPELSLNIIDRYLVAIEDVGLAPVILVNKVDLLSEQELEELSQKLEIYRSLGYPVMYSSTHKSLGFEQIHQQLKGHTSIFVGQSGVGKSSLVNQLLPEQDILTKEVSEVSGLGQHTTTTARLYSLPQGGQLIDSPGVREFQLWHLEKERVTWGFREFREPVEHCRFRDCKHEGDPGCGLQAAIDNHQIDPVRHDSFLRILDSMVENKPSRNIRGR
ncbi:small ribosomal subunit biogenesis GTPase RsgA [Alginatibacterium sediminis]|uniref:Small ribosomal subunit biogenesis GTPase RsgA n=1 Tax=Alginatibacterium sediminis TaxID=2164068 RepID=A0A420E7X1_9ALTE|nr:small ribosomal subunit biogenesis GTPase RsgA [Alginatibacterium sediminis]RKF14519.1 small ribosomal subunit biogenesis GTPase RsgA [Alginatibacterium sediminis]